MECMLGAISESRKELSPYAPKVFMMKIEPDQIKDVIGTGGKTINEIIEKSHDVKIDIEQDGRVTIYHYDQEAIDIAAKLIENIVRKAEIGEVYDGKVVRVEDKFAFVELFEGTNGFLHVGDVAHERINKVSDVLKLGDYVKVKVTKITDKGVNVSRKALLPKPIVKKEEKPNE